MDGRSRAGVDFLAERMKRSGGVSLESVAEQMKIQPHPDSRKADKLMNGRSRAKVDLLAERMKRGGGVPLELVAEQMKRNPQSR